MFKDDYHIQDNAIFLDVWMCELKLDLAYILL